MMSKNKKMLDMKVLENSQMKRKMTKFRIMLQKKLRNMELRSKRNKTKLIRLKFQKRSWKLKSMKMLRWTEFMLRRTISLLEMMSRKSRKSTALKKTAIKTKISMLELKKRMISMPISNKHWILTATMRKISEMMKKTLTCKLRSSMSVTKYHLRSPLQNLPRRLL